MEILKPPMGMNFVSNNVAENWRRFERQFRCYYAACGIATKSGPTQVGILLHTAGPGAQDVHETFTYTGDEQINDIETVLLKFRTYCEPRKNIVFERYQFWDCNQNASEPIDQWVTDLRSKAAKCEFVTFESDMIRDKVVFGVRDQRIKERLLREADLTLNKALNICRAAEISQQQIEVMGATQTQVPVHTMQARSKKGGRYKKATSSMPTQSSDDKREYNTPACKYCGRSHAPRQCSAFGKVCRKCGGSNHFASVCLKGRSSARSPAPSRRPVHTVESGETSGLFIGTVYVGEIDRSGWHANLFVCSQEVCFKLDSGADANVLPLETYERLGSGSPLMETTIVLTAFGNAKIRPDGEVKLPVVNQDFYVTRSSDIAILGCKACIELDLVRRVSVDTVAENDVLTEENMRAQYSDVFTGMGEYEKEYHIEVDSNVKPVIQRCRKVPYARYDKLKHTLVDLEK